MYACPKYPRLFGGFGDAQLLVGSVRNLLAVTVGNILGGSILVARVYWLAYLRPGAEAMTSEALPRDTPDAGLERH